MSLGDTKIVCITHKLITLKPPFLSSVYIIGSMTGRLTQAHSTTTSSSDALPVMLRLLYYTSGLRSLRVFILMIYLYKIYSNGIYIYILYLNLPFSMVANQQNISKQLNRHSFSIYSS